MTDIANPETLGDVADLLDDLDFHFAHRQGNVFSVMSSIVRAHDVHALALQVSDELAGGSDV